MLSDKFILINPDLVTRYKLYTTSILVLLAKQTDSFPACHVTSTEFYLHGDNKKIIVNFTDTGNLNFYFEVEIS